VAKLAAEVELRQFVEKQHGVAAQTQEAMRQASEVMWKTVMELCGRSPDA
jgi:hypothetical protein